MTLFFNADYEQQLSYPSVVKIESNPMNQELEYFLFLLESEKVYTTRQYSKSYHAHIEALDGKIQTTDLKKDIECWWGSYENIEQMRFLNSKLTSTELAIKNQKCHPKTSIVKDVTLLSNIKKHYVYKTPFGMSGKGIYTALNHQQILKYLNTTPMIEEPHLNRIADMSCLNIGENLGQIFYENEVDQHFQYKGTTIGHLKMSCLIQKELKESCDIVTRFMKKHNANATWSMDAFTYLESGVEKLYGISEINYRKTMGYVAYRLHKKWYTSGVSQLLLIPAKKVNDPLFSYHSKNIKVLSPKGNRFMSFFLHGESIEEVNEVRKRLNLDFDVIL